MRQEGQDEPAAFSDDSDLGAGKAPNLVSIIVPCRDERDTIGLLLEALWRQDFGPESFEVIIADGMSSDGTPQAIGAFQAAHPTMRMALTENPNLSIPSALNTAIARSNGDLVLRLDAHSCPAPDYVRRCVEVLRQTGAANVGGAWDIRPAKPGAIARAIAAAVSHPLGAGDARYRYGTVAGEVDTVPFGAFPRSWLDRVGPFNEQLLTNEDYEFNYRLRQAGGRIWFDPAIRSVYFARPSLSALWRQYWRYGFWKARMLLTYPASMRLRQAIPPACVLTAVLLALLGLAWPAAWTGLGGLTLAYLAVLFLAAAWQGLRRRDITLVVGMPLAWGVVHGAWGLGFLAGVPVAWRNHGDRE